MPARQGDEPVAALLRHHRAGWVLVGSDRVDELRLDTLRREFVEDPLQRVHIHAIVVDRHARDLGAELAEGAQGA